MSTLRTALALSLSLGAITGGPGRLSAFAAEPALPPGIVDAKTARALVASGVKVVDVRTAAEFEAGHVPGAINIPFDEIGRRAGEIGSKETAVLLYCRTGRRSGIAAQTLRGLGYEKLYDLQRFDDWVASGP